MVSVRWAGSRVWLKISKEIESIRKANQRLAARVQLPEPLSHGGFVIAAFDSEPSVRATRLPAITKQEDFVVIDKSSRFTFNSLIEAYESKRWPTRGRP